MSVVCLGEAMVELSIDRADANTARLGIAGDTLNTAVYLKRGLLGVGSAVSVSYATCMGKDVFSDRLFALLDAESIETDLVGRLDDALPGLYAINTDDDGERSFSYWRDSAAARQLFLADGSPSLEAVARAELLYVSGITLAILEEPAREALLEHIARWRAADGTRRFVFDSNYRPRLWPSQTAARDWTARAWRLCDYALPSLDDEMALFGDASEAAMVERLRGYGITRGALKRGADGPFCFKGSHVGKRFTPVERVVDTTAAGDSFNGAWLAARIAGGDAGAALDAGHACAAHVITQPGAIVPLQNSPS